MNKHSQMKCPICGKSHNFFRIVDLSKQLAVSIDTIQRRVSSIPHLKIGKMRLIPECCLPEIFELHYPSDTLSEGMKP